MKNKVKKNKIGKSFKVFLDGKKVLAKEGETVLELARRNGINIPSFCYHPDLSVKMNCRVCVVEIKDCLNLKTSCSTLVEEGMEIITSSPRVKKARETNLELIYASHVERCGTCSYRFDCELLRTAKDYNLNIKKFKDRKIDRKTYKFANAVEIDGSQCIDCRNCLEACANQSISYLELVGSGVNQEIKPKKSKDFACVYCGQCTLCCPVASAQEQDQSLELEKILKLNNKTVIAQLDPALRVSLGELFQLGQGKDCEGKIISALKKLGFKYVFDINSATDISAILEAEEFIKRIDDKKAVWPMLSSSCPSWVAYVEFYHPELVKNLSISRSPHIQGAGLIKKYWSKKRKIKEEDIITVSLVPCTAKKYEADRKELQLDGKPLVDYVLTTRELAFLLKKNKIDLSSLEDESKDLLLSQDCKLNPIYSSNGGTLESVFKNVFYKLNKAKTKDMFPVIELKDSKYGNAVKETKLSLAGKNYNIAVVDGLANFSQIANSLSKYHYIEVMACPGGCIGGGGQPIPSTEAIKEKRLTALTKIDKKRKYRAYCENNNLLSYFKFLKDNNLSKKLLYTSFKKSKGSILSSTNDNK